MSFCTAAEPVVPSVYVTLRLNPFAVKLAIDAEITPRLLPLLLVYLKPMHCVLLAYLDMLFIELPLPPENITACAIGLPARANPFIAPKVFSSKPVLFAPSALSSLMLNEPMLGCALKVTCDGWNGMPTIA